MIEYIIIYNKVHNNMKIFFLLFLLLSSLFSDVYYSKVEPIQIKKIASNVNGQIVFVNENKLGQLLKDEIYIKIDTQLDKDELASVKQKIQYIEKTLEVDHKILENLKQTQIKKRANYAKVVSLKIKSTLEKDKEFYDFIATQNQYLTTQKEINNLYIQLLDIKLREEQLLKSIKDKNIKSKGFLLYSLAVKIGEVVNKGTPLATLADTSKAILTLYLNKEDAMKARKSIIYLNGKKTAYKISRLLPMADVQNISQFKAQVIINAPKLFSKLVKVELKND